MMHHLSSKRCAAPPEMGHKLVIVDEQGVTRHRLARVGDKATRLIDIETVCCSQHTYLCRKQLNLRIVADYSYDYSYIVHSPNKTLGSDQYLTVLLSILPAKTINLAACSPLSNNAYQGRIAG